MLESLFYFLIVIGVLVFFHELGHFMAAKAFGMKVDVFSLGMGPRAFGFQRGETDYRVSYFPLGGYVKIAGMIDESMDTEFVNQKPEPWEYRSKPRWQRMIVISAGVIMNVIIAGIIFSYINFSNGKMLYKFDANKPIVVQEGSIAETMGLQTGDYLIKINDREIKYWNDLNDLEEISAVDLNFTYRRDGRTQVVYAPDKFHSLLSESGSLGLVLTIDPIVGGISPGSPAEKIGLQVGDKIVAINDVKMATFSDIPTYLKSLDTDEVTLTVQRGNRTLTMAVTLDNKMVGIAQALPPSDRVEYGLVEAVGEGFASTVTRTGAMVNGFVRIFQGKEDASAAIGGPIKIFQLSGQFGSMGLDMFLNFIAMLSLSLALINILPIPALDGGHLMILLIEATARRDLSEKFKMGVQQVGFAILITLMVVVIFNDIVNLW